jgi:hypothetical protein
MNVIVLKTILLPESIIHSPLNILELDKPDSTGKLKDLVLNGKFFGKLQLGTFVKKNSSAVVSDPPGSIKYILSKQKFVSRFFCLTCLIHD